MHVFFKKMKTLNASLARPPRRAPPARHARAWPRPRAFCARCTSCASRSSCACCALSARARPHKCFRICVHIVVSVRKTKAARQWTNGLGRRGAKIWTVGLEFFGENLDCRTRRKFRGENLDCRTGRKFRGRPATALLARWLHGWGSLTA